MWDLLPIIKAEDSWSGFERVVKAASKSAITWESGQITGAMLKDEFMRRDLSIPAGASVAQKIQILKQDWEENDDGVPLDWLNRPPLAVELGKGERHFLQTEMEAEIEAEDGTAPDQPKKDSGYTGLPHAKMCLHGEECTNNEFDVEVPLHACYFCPASECARCAGLSIRQVRLKNPLDFVCSQCVDEARKNARVFVG